MEVDATPGDAAADWPLARCEGDPLRVRSCDTTLRYVPPAGERPLRVEFRHEGHWGEPTPMAPAGDGSFTLTRRFRPGLYAYKFVVDGDWRFDPANPYVAYDGGTANSGLRVPDCGLPRLEVAGQPRPADNAFAATVRFTAGAGGCAPAETRATLIHDFVETPLSGAFDPARWTFEVALVGLAPGKYTVRLEATDAAGQAAEPLLLPFWIEPEPFSWADAFIALVMTNRGPDGDPGNNAAPTPEAHPTADWHGGDLRGVTALIDAGYFDALGVRALWLTPFQRGTDDVQRAARIPNGVTGYHGYWPVDPREVDPRLGSPDDLRALVAAAHARGIRVLMDLVVNHVYEDHTYVADHPDWFTDGCICGSAGCDWTTHARSCLFASYMPDIDWRNRQAGEAFVADALWWLETFDLDGARVDAVKHVHEPGIFNVATRIRERFETAGVDYFLVGETAMGWDGDNSTCDNANYQAINEGLAPGGLDGQFDFVLFHAVVESVFLRGARGAIHLDYWTLKSQECYRPGAVMVPYVASHDTSRIVSLADYRGQDPAHDLAIPGHEWPEEGLPEAPGDAEPYERVRTAFCWLLTIPGAPLLYLGDEYGEFGGHDPDNRHDFRAEDTLNPREAALLADVRALGQLRQTLPALRRGRYVTLGAADDGQIAFARLGDDDRGPVVGINLAATEATKTADVLDLGFAPDTNYQSLLPFGGALALGAAGPATLTLPPRSCAVFLP